MANVQEVEIDIPPLAPVDPIGTYGMQPSTLNLGRKNYLIGCFLSEQRQNTGIRDFFLDAHSVGLSALGIRRDFIKILLKIPHCLRLHVQKILLNTVNESVQTYEIRALLYIL